MSDVEQVLEARARDLGGGVMVGRVLPTAARRFIGPFLFLDHMGPTTVDLGVRPHPHLHLATVTYLFEGAILHRDSVGSKQIIEPGAINWMVAGTGIAHSERAPEAQHTAGVHGLQIWVGLPKAHEDTAPAFEHTPASRIPEVAGEGVRLRVLAGTAFGATSPVSVLSPMCYVDIELAAGARLVLPADHAERAIYLVEGEVEIGDARIEPRRLAVIAPGATPTLVASRASRLVLLGGEPLDGPRYMWWNFVSSSQDRIRAAAEDWRARKWPGVTDDASEFIPLPEELSRFAAPKETP